MLDNVNEFDIVIDELHKSDALKQIILIGSWTLHVYQSKYSEIESDSLTTSDIDFSIQRAFAEEKISLPSIKDSLRKLGYKSYPKGGPPEGQIFKPDISHGENKLSIEFLCTSGRWIKQPYLVKGFSVIATH